MTKRTHRLRNSALTCLLVAWPLFAGAQPQGENEPARLSVSHTAPLAPDDPLRVWFKEQDRLLDDILLRLSRIENLVSALQQLIQQLPAASAPGVQSTPPAPAQPQPKATPVAPVLPLVTVAPTPRPARHTTGILAFFDEWGTLLAGGGLLLLVLMIVSRHNRSRQSNSAQPQAKTGTQPVSHPGQAGANARKSAQSDAA